MIRKSIVLCCCVVLLLTGCFFDPYSDERPLDYGDALWICDEPDVWFCINMEKEDSHIPEGEIRINENRYFGSFYFIHKTNELYINIYPLKYATIPDDSRDRRAVVGHIEGECDFSSESLTYSIGKVEGDIFNRNMKEMTFQRVELPLSINSLVKKKKIDDMLIMTYVSQKDSIVMVSLAKNGEGKYSVCGYTEEISLLSPSELVVTGDADQFILSPYRTYNDTVYGWCYPEVEPLVNEMTPLSEIYKFKCQGKTWTLKYWWISDIENTEDIEISFSSK